MFHFLLFCLDCIIWTKTKINYIFVFEYDTRHALDCRQLTEVSDSLIVTHRVVSD